MRTVKSIEFTGYEFLLHFSDGGSREMLSLPSALMLAEGHDRKALTARILQNLELLGQARWPVADTILALLLMDRMGEESRPCHFLHVSDSPDRILAQCVKGLQDGFHDGGTFRFVKGWKEDALPFQFFDGVFLDHSEESISSSMAGRCAAGLREGGALFCFFARRDMASWMGLADPEGEVLALEGGGYLFFRRKTREDCLAEQMGEAIR